MDRFCFFRGGIDMLIYVLGAYLPTDTKAMDFILRVKAFFLPGSGGTLIMNGAHRFNIRP